MIYSPFVQHATLQGGSKSTANACGWRSVDVAIQTIRTAEELRSRGMLFEAYVFTMDVLAMAATVLLVMQLGGSSDGRAETIRRASRTAKALLEWLATRNNIAQQCLEALQVSREANESEPQTDRESQPVYQSIDQISPASNAAQDSTPYALGFRRADDSGLKNDAVDRSAFVADPTTALRGGTVDEDWWKFVDSAAGIPDGSAEADACY